MVPPPFFTSCELEAPVALCDAACCLAQPLCCDPEVASHTLTATAYMCGGVGDCERLVCNHDRRVVYL